MSWGGAFWWPHTVLVKDVTPAGGLGSSYTPRAAPVPAEVTDEQQLVRSPDGQEVVSSTQVVVDLAAHIGLGALVTVWDGTAAKREATVLQVGRVVNDPPLPSHLVLYLT